jgi:hypothetical protein
MQIYFTVVLGDVDGAKFNNKKNLGFRFLFLSDGWHKLDQTQFTGQQMCDKTFVNRIIEV